MKIDSAEFGSITVGGATYPHNILIRLSGEVVKRKKKLSKKYYGTSHLMSREEAEFVYEKGCDTLVLGAGQYGNVKLSPEAAEFFDHHHCRVILQPTPDAIETYNKTRGKTKTIGLFTSRAESLRPGMRQDRPWWKREAARAGRVPMRMLCSSRNGGREFACGA
jgi:hypothetical protein